MFKVWIHIEHIDETKDIYEGVTLPVSVGEFTSLRRAQEFVDKLETIQPDKPVKKKMRPDYAP